MVEVVVGDDVAELVVDADQEHWALGGAVTFATAHVL